MPAKIKPDGKLTISNVSPKYSTVKARAKSDVDPTEIPLDSPLDMETVSYTSISPTDAAKQTCSLVDLNTVTGSTETIRNSLGGYFFTDTDSFGLLNVPPSFAAFNPVNSPHENIFSITSITGAVVETPMEQRGIGSNYSDYRKTMLPYSVFTCRIEGDPTSIYLDDIMKGSKYWKTLFVGGDFLEKYIPPIFTTGTYDNNFTVISMPYNNKDKIYFKNKEVAHDFMAATYDYNRHFGEYQEWASRVDSERKLPNIYMLYTVAGATQAPDPAGNYNREYSESLVEDYNLEYYTFGKALDIIDLGSIFFPSSVTPEMFDTTTPDWDEATGMNNTTQYINQHIPSKYNSISPSILTKQDFKNRNLIYGFDSVHAFCKEGSLVNENAPRWPYYNKIEIAVDSSINRNSNVPSTFFRTIMEENGADILFMKMLKESFLGQTNGVVPIRNQQFMKTSKYITGSSNLMRDNIVTSNQAVSYRNVDLLKMLVYGYENVYNTLGDFQVVDWSDLKTVSAIDTRGLYRAVNSKRIASLISDVFSTFGRLSAGTKVTDIVSLLNCKYSNIHDRDVSTYPSIPFEDLSPDPAYNEIVAYRIEKVGGDPTGDSNTRGIIQNFWIYADEAVEKLKYLDTQVKYGKDYEYRIYAYYIVRGYKYRYSDLQLSRIIGQVREDGYAGPLEFGTGLDGGPPTAPLAYCLEYYDPYTDRAIPDALAPSSDIYNTSPEVMEKISSLSGDAQRIGVSSFRDARGGRAYPPYVAQFNVSIQPSLKIMEVPLMRKTYKILDNPPNEIDVVPGYTLKNDNTITFSMHYQTFGPHKYPRAIQTDDMKNRADYVNANDISEQTFIQSTHESVSHTREVEIYRLNAKPKSFKDFATTTARKVSLKIDGSKFSYTTALFNDIIKSNQKYYYLFRVVNDNNIAGNVDTIIEAELVNDGGYKYAIFDTLFEEDLIEKEFINPSVSFKNIFQLSPNMSQIMVNSSEANFNNPLALFGDENSNEVADYLEKGSEYTKVNVGVAEDLIWGKTFKIRLTSKKTGKKIDLNITYSDPDIFLEK